jgi:hypothetical protein
MQQLRKTFLQERLIWSFPRTSTFFVSEERLKLWPNFPSKIYCSKQRVEEASLKQRVEEAFS